jgi:hypothetical protein
VNRLLAYFTSPTFGFFLKLLAGLATAGFGMLGIGTKTRDDNGHLTRGGRIALIGIIIAAALGIGSLVYEYAGGQEKAQADRRRSERLMLSVQRGVYPMRGLKVALEMDLAGDFARIAAYKKRLRDEVSRDRECKSAGSGFQCYGSDEKGYYLYRIDASSPLFPRSSSLEGHILENLYVHVSFYQLPGNGDSTHSQAMKYLGRFFVHWREKLPGQAWVAYDYNNNSLRFGTADHSISDAEVSTAGIYSMVDFIPGIVVANPQVTGSRLCEQLGLATEACSEQVLTPLNNSLSLREISLVFPYPKTIRVQEGIAIRCDTGRGKNLVLRLPDDIEAIDGNGKIENFREDQEPQLTCETLASLQ